MSNIKFKEEINKQNERINKISIRMGNLLDQQAELERRINALSKRVGEDITEIVKHIHSNK